jgi:hypothetical protein
MPERIKHAAWRTEMENGIVIARLMAARLDVRIAAIEAKGAGEEHVDLVRLRMAGMEETAALGEQILAAADDVAIAVGEALQRAGGMKWVARDKKFATHE